MTNNNYPVELPKTYTVSYYNSETDQNLSAEEWKQLSSEVSPSEVKIVNQGEVYQSWKILSDNPSYGPGNSQASESFNASAYKPYIKEKIIYSDYIRFKLNRELEYDDGLFKHIDCANNSTYRDYEVGDSLWVNKGEIIKHNSNHTFNNTYIVRKKYDDENDIDPDFEEFAESFCEMTTGHSLYGDGIDEDGGW